LAAEVSQLFSEHATSQRPSRPSKFAPKATDIKEEVIKATICITLEATFVVRGFTKELFMGFVGFLDKEVCRGVGGLLDKGGHKLIELFRDKEVDLLKGLDKELDKAVEFCFFIGKSTIICKPPEPM